jgi:heat shock protein HslJ
MRILLNCLICLGMISEVAVVPTQVFAEDKPDIHRAGPDDLEGRQWGIQHYDSISHYQLYAFPLSRKGDPNLTFKNGAVEGTTWCGKLSGTYRRVAEQLTISAVWEDDNKSPCSDKQRKDAQLFLKDVNSVTQIESQFGDWLLLTDHSRTTRIPLVPIQLGTDLSELQYTFWHPTLLKGSSADFEDVIIEIGPKYIIFSTHFYSVRFDFKYKLAGLEFSPESLPISLAQKSRTSQDELTSKAFKRGLHEVASYELHKGTLTFYGKDRQPIIVLKSLPKKGIENRFWWIAKYRGNDTQPVEEEGLTDAMEMAQIIFMNGQLIGSPGCGGWIKTYKLSGNHLTLQAKTGISGFCLPEYTAQGGLVEESFKGTLRIEKKGDNILLRDKNGRAQILLMPY